jgi:hypothetical protein
MDGGSATIAQFQMAGDKIRVKMREEHVADPEAEFPGIVEVLLDIALGIHNDGGGAGLVPQEIRSMSKTAQVILFENHEDF